MNLSEITKKRFEELHIFLKNGQLKAAICVGDTRLSEEKFIFHNKNIEPFGPSGLGGIRRWMYQTDAALIGDVLQLAYDGMALKSALAGLMLGGAKMVVKARPHEKKNEDFYQFVGECINILKGAYIGGEDMNISPEDVQKISKYTPYVVGTPKEYGGSGDPSPYTKDSVFYSLEALLDYLGLYFEEASFVVQGIGHVGWGVLEELYRRKAKRIIISDTDTFKITRAAKKFQGIEIALPYDPQNPDIIRASKMDIATEADIFMPCGPGGILNIHSLPYLKFKGICGSANNQCRDMLISGKLFEKEIVCIPDFLANNGGLINVSDELYKGGYNEERVKRHIEQNRYRAKWLLEKMDKEKRSPIEIAIELAEDFIEKKAKRPKRKEKIIKIHEF